MAELARRRAVWAVVYCGTVAYRVRSGVRACFVVKIKILRTSECATTDPCHTRKGRDERHTDQEEL